MLKGFLLVWLVAVLLLYGGQGSANSLGEGASGHHDVVFVLDNSASMKKLDPRFRLREIVKGFIAEAAEGSRVGVVVFDETARLLAPLMSLDSESRQHLGAALERLDYRGALSDPASGIERAVYELRRHGRSNGAKSVLLVTDGIIDVGSAGRAENVSGWVTGELAAEAAAETIGVFGIALSEKADYRLFQSLAYNTEAEYFRAHDMREIAPILKQITERQRHAVRSGSEIGVTTPEGADKRPQSTESSAVYLAARVATSLPAAAEEPMLIFPLGRTAAGPLLADATGMPSRLFVTLWGVALLALMAALALGVWALSAGARRRRQPVAAASPPQKSAVPRAFLYDLNGATDSELHDVSNDVTVIGRPITAQADSCSGQLLLKDPTISRRHAIIEYRHHGFWLIDQRSRNGTYVGGKRVRHPVCLRHNDRITISNIDFEFHVTAMEEAAETVLMRA